MVDDLRCKMSMEHFEPATANRLSLSQSHHKSLVPSMSSSMRRRKTKSRSRRRARSNGSNADYNSLEQRLALTHIRGNLVG